MARLDHLALLASDVAASKRWYVDVLGLEVEMETEEPPFCGLRDERDTTIFLSQSAGAAPAEGLAMWFCVEDVDAFYARHRETATFVHGPQRTLWGYGGYGAELLDPTGHVVRLWDEASMRDQDPNGGNDGET
jgi:catechol 2,3-dioxygenase-like lactoylglutathione lyase family enzyme